jgi:Transmembrane family 220, helix
VPAWFLGCPVGRVHDRPVQRSGRRPVIVIYGLPAIWAGFAAYRPNAFEHNHLLVGVFWLNLLAIAAGSIYIWPSEVTTWWNNEEVREGLGLIITTIAMLMVAFTVWRTRRGQLEHFAT